MAVVIVLLLAVGAWVGLRSPVGTKHPRVYDGIAMRANPENDLVLFDASDGTQATFGADDTWWEAESASGEGNAPCLEVPLRKAEVEIGLMRVANPSGGWHMEVVWVKCL
ncbi:MAG: hypothetical protein ACRDPJ_01085 [Nocardioidaceae bacterium]